jgi:acetyl-CoA acetyltransferase
VLDVYIYDGLRTDVIVDCANQAGEDSRNGARHASLLAGLDPSVAALTVNLLCGSGLAALLDASQAASVGQGELSSQVAWRV